MRLKKVFTSLSLLPFLMTSPAGATEAEAEAKAQEKQSHAQVKTTTATPDPVPVPVLVPVSEPKIVSITEPEPALATPVPENMFEIAAFDTGESCMPYIVPMVEKPTLREKEERDPFLRIQQRRLRSLGIDLGKFGADGYDGTFTRQAFREFLMFYGPLFGHTDLLENPNREQLLAEIKHFADWAARDANTYGVSSRTVAAIRLAALRTGVDFTFLMELGEAESSFNNNANAKTSTALGLYQFIEETWLRMVKSYGHKYGLGLYADQISFYTNDDGEEKPTVSNPIVHRQILELRRNPRISAFLAAEYVLENEAKMACNIGGKIGDTERYFGHFLGADHAILFLYKMKENPHQSAAALFPEQAKKNQGVFYKWVKQKNGRTVKVDRSLKEVYDYFSTKFGTGKYDDAPYTSITATAGNKFIEPGPCIAKATVPRPLRQTDSCRL